MSATESIPATVHAGPGGTRPDQERIDVGHLKRRLEKTVRGEVRFDAGEGDSDAVERAVAYLLREMRPDGSFPNGAYLHTNVPPDTFFVYPEAARFYPLEALGKYDRVLRRRRGPPAPQRYDHALLDFVKYAPGEGGRPAPEILLVATKIDKVGRGEQFKIVSALGALVGAPAIGASSVTGQGKSELGRRIALALERAGANGKFARLVAVHRA